MLTMSTLKTKKINKLIGNWQKGSVKLTASLNALGYQNDLLRKYVVNEWIESLGYGAFKLRDDDIKWYGAIAALQQQKNMAIHPGGKTALSLKGYSHYGYLGGEKIFLFGKSDEKIPGWFTKQKFDPKPIYSSTSVFEYDPKQFLSETSIDNLTIYASIPELAALEMIYLIPREQTFDEALLIMNNLATLRPDKIQILLENCSSVKVKRIFMWMAEHCNHQWVEEINTSKINFGKGKRVIAKNGKLDKKYNITVPNDDEEQSIF